MVDMFVRYEGMAHIHPIISGGFYLMEDRIAASAVHHKQLSLIFYDKTGVIALCDERITRSEHCNFHILSPEISLYRSDI